MRLRTAAILAAIAGSMTGADAFAQLSFAAKPTFAECTPLHYPTRARLFDMDGDGDDDLVLPGRDRENVLNWCTLLPDGSFGPMQVLPIAGQCDDAVAADVDGDGARELVLVIRAYAGKVQVLRRTKAGTLAADPPVTFDREPRSAVAGDFDGDGDVDLAVCFYGSEHLAVLRNDGTGAFAASQRIRVDPWTGAIPGPQDVMSADLDGDGRSDLVVGCIGTRRFDVFAGRADGSFAPPVSWLAPDFPGVTRPAVVGFDLGDIDGDGDVDILAPLLSSTSGQPLVGFLNDGAGGFGERVLLASTASGAGYHWGARLCDFDGDGRLDALTSTALPGNVFVWRNVGTPGAPAFAAAGRLDYSSFARDMLCTNVDGDCDADVVIADIAGHYVLGYLNLRDCASFAPPGGGSGGGGAEASYSFGSSEAVEIALRLAAAGPSPDLAGTAFADPPAACGPAGAGGRCDEPHATPGCFTTPCCEVVCGIAPDCCAIAWDQLCVDIAQSECNGLVCPSYGACDAVHEDPGCEDPECCARITRLDGYCDGATWDRVCVERAVALCGLPPCTIDVPPDALPDAEPCYDRLDDGATTDGAVRSLSLGQRVAGSCTTGAPRDADWHSIVVPAGELRLVRLRLDAEFPAEVHVLQGTMAGPLRMRTSSFGGRCGQFTVDVLAGGAEPTFVVVTMGMDAGPIRGGQPCTTPDPDNPPPPDAPPPVPGFDGARYVLAAECLDCGIVGDLDGDGDVDGADLGLLLGEFGISGPSIADLNRDGRVNGADLGILLGAWSAG